MGPGYGAMNDLVIIQTSQGLSSYLESIIPSEKKSKGVVISFDNRYNSHRYCSCHFLLYTTMCLFSAKIS